MKEEKKKILCRWMKRMDKWRLGEMRDIIIHTGNMGSIIRQKKV